ncbi:MAG: caspase family protein, partial [Elusimicrobiota bacterium]
EWLPKNTTAKSRVFFYFSGHGSPDTKTGQAYLVPADGDPAFLKSTAYALNDLYASLEHLPAARIVVGLDSCFSGAGGRSVLAKGVRPLVGKIDMGTPAAGGRLVVLAAAEGDQLSGGLASEQQGAFTHFLLRGLEGAAQDAQGRITAGSLAAFIRPKVADAARRQNREQTPVLYGDPATVLFELK